MCNSHTVSHVVRCCPPGRKKKRLCLWLIWSVVVFYISFSKAEKYLSTLVTRGKQQFVCLWVLPHHFSHHGSLQVIILCCVSSQCCLEEYISSISGILKTRRNVKETLRNDYLCLFTKGIFPWNMFYAFFIDFSITCFSIDVPSCQS